MGYHKESLGVEILRYLNQSGRIPRKNLYTPFCTNTSYRYYARIVQALIKDGHVGVERFNRKNYVYITERGRERLQAAYEEDEQAVNEIAEEYANPKSAKQKRRTRLVADVVGLCAANGFRTSTDDKPPLDAIVRTKVGMPEHQALKEETKEAIGEGIYYSLAEVRSAYISIVGKNELANWTRLVGIALFNGHLSFLYSVNASLIQWMPSNEKRSVDFIVAFLRMSDILRELIDFRPYQSCIVCGEGMTMIPKLVTGRKWGRNDGAQNTERYRAKFAASHINAHNLSKVYSSAYYAPTSRYGVDMFRLAAMLDTQIHEQIADRWYSDISTAIRLKTLRYYQGVTTNGKNERVVYLPCIDLIELEYLAHQGVPCHIVTAKGTQQAVARVLGPLVLSMRSLTGERLSYKAYDEHGAPIK